MIGEEALAWVERTGVGARTPLHPASLRRCMAGGAHCAMRVLRSGGEWWAFCGQRPPACDDLAIAPDDALRVAIDADSLGPVLQAALGLDQELRAQLDVIRLGQRSLGATAVDFVLVPCPETSGPWFEEIAAREIDGRFAVAVFHTSALPARPPADPRIHWFALSEAVPTSSGLQLPLFPVLRRLAPVAVDPASAWPPFTFMVGRGGTRGWYRNRPVEPPSTAGRLLLLALLRRPGVWLSRSALYGAVFPDARGRTTSLPDRLRKAKKDVADALADAGGAGVLSSRPAGNEDDHAGVYLLDLLPNEIGWMDPADLADVGGPRRGP